MQPIAGPQLVPAAGVRQAVMSTPLHCGEHSPVLAPQLVRVPCTAPRTALHVPSEPGTSQAAHWLAQGALQHTPSTQLPEPHCDADVQLAAFGKPPTGSASPADVKASVSPCVIANRPESRCAKPPNAISCPRLRSKNVT